MVRCRYLRRDGAPCGGVATEIHGGCFQHDASYELDRKRAAKRGQKGKASGHERSGTADLERLKTGFEELARRVLDGEADKSDAAVVTQLCNGARSCILASAKLREIEEIETRIEALETTMQPHRDHPG